MSNEPFNNHSEVCRTCLTSDDSSLSSIFFKSDDGDSAPLDIFAENEFVQKYLFQYLNVRHFNFTYIS